MRIESIMPFFQEASGILKRLSERYSVTLGFNAFELVSDVYRKENFHSDILKAILDPKSKHGEGTLFLQLFVKYLQNVAMKQDKAIVMEKLSKLQRFERAHVTREEGRIDVLIDFEKYVILVENKINGADDMERQLPRYVEYVETSRLDKKEVAAIVYLTSAQPKQPNEYSWTKIDQDKIRPLLLSVVGFSEEYPYFNLVQGWLEPCQLRSSRFASVAVLSQYCELLRNQAGVTMNNKIVEELLIQMTRNDIDYFELKEAIDYVPHAIASMVIEACADKPGLRKKPWLAWDVVAVFDFAEIQVSKRKVFFAIDVHCEDLDGTGVSFFARSGNNKPIERYLPTLRQFDNRFKYDKEVWPERLVLQLSKKEEYANINAFIGKIASLVDFVVRHFDSLAKIALEK